MAKYNVGDKVKVRADLSGKYGAIPDMVENFAGKVVTIAEVHPKTFTQLSSLASELGHSLYRIKEGLYVWSDDMFEGLAENETPAESHKSSKMPKLTNGMFGVDITGDMFVVVGEYCVFKGGLFNKVSFFEEDHPEYVKALYDSKCFNAIDDGFADLIWENIEVKPKEDKKCEEAAHAFLGFLAAFADYMNDDKDKAEQTEKDKTE